MNVLTGTHAARAGLWGAALCLLAVVTASIALPGYSHLQHPLSLPGARGVPTAAWFNALAFVLPGALALLAALALRTRLRGAGWAARIGTQLLQLSALAFAAQGLLPLDPDDLESASSRLHAGAWTGWWIAFVPGALLLATGLRGGGPDRGRAAPLAIAALLVLMAGLPALLWPGPPVQRLAVAAWLLAYAALARIAR